MSRRTVSRKTIAVEDQVSAAAVGSINTARRMAEQHALSTQDEALDRALAAMQKVWRFIGEPEKILGSDKTKHGEIAEHVEVGVRRARDLLAQTTPTADIDSLHRTGPADYLIHGIEVQSKFLNGANRTLDAVLEHMNKYGYFARGENRSFYHVPREYHALVLKVLNGEQVEGLNSRTVKKLLEKVSEIESVTGKPFREVVQPSVSTYAEVQQGKVVHTLNGHDSDLKQQNKTLKDQIRVDHAPSISEAVRAAGVGAAVGASVGFAAVAIKKYRRGKNVFKGQFTARDWKEAGLESAKAGALGGVSAAAIYGLTNYAELSAPFAGALVSAVKGLAPLVNDYRQGRMSEDALIDAGMLVCTDVALVGICTVIGQTVIPVPVLGAVVGSVAGKVFSALLAGQVKGMQKAVDQRMALAMAMLDDAYQRIVKKVVAEFRKLGDLTDAAFDERRNEFLVSDSLALARAHGVPEARLMKSRKQMDSFFLD